MTTTSTVGQQGGNYATVMKRERGKACLEAAGEEMGKECGGESEDFKLQADMLEKSKVDKLCVQETRWKESNARSI